MTDNTVAKITKDKITNNDVQKIHIKLMIEKHKPHWKPWVNSGAPEG